MSAVRLPPLVCQQIRMLGRRLGLLLLVKRLSLLAIVLAAAFVAAFLADLLIGVPNLWLRVVAVAFALALGGGVLAILRAAWQAPPPRALTALIEDGRPELAERLTSAVLLAEEHGRESGAPALVGLLMNEADHAARQVDVRRVLSARAPFRWSAAAAACLALAVFPLLASARYADFGERLLLAWFRPLNDFRFEVTPAEGAFAIGRPLTITARLVPRGPRVVLPGECALRIRLPDGETQAVPMTVRNGAFSCTLDGPAGDLTFQIDAGNSQSEPHMLTAVRPVILLPESFSVTVAPPEYARGSGVRKLSRPLAVTAFEYSDIHLDMRFDRPPVAAHLQLVAPAGDVHRVPLRLDADRASVALPMLPAGSYSVRLHALAEHGIETVQELTAIEAQVDRPPTLHMPNATAGTGRSVPADDVLRIRYAAQDDLGIASLDIEYRINDAPAKVEAVADAAGKLSHSGEERLRLSGKVKPGDTLRYRLRASDARDVKAGVQVDFADRNMPQVDLLPQSALAPADTDVWVTLTVDDAAAPLAKQNIEGDRERVRKWIDGIRTKVVVEKNQLDKFRRDSFHQPIMGLAQEKQLASLRAQNREVHADLTLFAHQAATQEMLANLADLAADIANKEIEQSGTALARVAEKRALEDARDRAVVAADNALAGALRRIDELARRNEQLAEYRFDQLKLEELAEQQEALARRAAELAAKPGAETELEKLRAEQQRIAGELSRLTQQSQLFQQALRQARAEQVRQVARQTQALAQEQQSLAQAMRDRLKKELSPELLRLAEKQQTLANSVTTLRKETDAVAKEQGIAPLADASPHQAAKSLRAVEVEEALARQSESADELDRFAGELTGRGMTWDPRGVVQRLAQAQAAIKGDLEQLGKDLVKLSSDQMIAKLREVIGQQRGLADELSKLATLYPKRAGAREAAQHAGEAAEHLGRADALTAFGAMEKAHAAIEMTAQSFPGADEFRQTLAAELTELRNLQEKTATEAAAVVKEADRARVNELLVGLVKRQTEIVGRVGGLVVGPKHEALRKRLADALAAALVDLRQAKADRLQQMPAALEQFKGIVLGLIQPENNAPPTPSARHAARVWKLQEEQLALRAELEAILAGAAGADLLAQQKELAEQTDKLRQALKEMEKGDAGKSPEAAQFAQAAAEAMKHAAEEKKDALMDAKSAAEMLAKSAEKTESLAKKLADDDAPFKFNQTEMAKTGEAVQEGEQKTEQAQMELSKQAPTSAPKAMQQAADAMNQAAAQAARQMSQLQQPGPAASPTAANRPGQGSTPQPGVLRAEDLEQFAGRPWDSLPGTLRTQIIQDLRGRYGEDYARIIQDYFRRLAEEP